LDRADLVQRATQIRERLEHLLRLAPGLHLRLFQQHQSARELVQHLLVAGLQFHAAAA